MTRNLFILVIFVFLALSSKTTENLMDPNRALPYSELPEQTCSIISDNSQLFNKSGNEESKLKTEEKSINSQTMIKLINSYGEKNENDLYCTATVVSGRELVTAGHCMTSITQKNFTIKCPGKPSIKVNPNNVKIHEEYGKPDKLSNDIAVITLDQPLGIRPAKIVQSVDELKKLKGINKCFTAGYGHTREERNFGNLAGTKKDMNSLKQPSPAKWKAFIELLKINQLFSRAQDQKTTAFILNKFFSEENSGGSEAIGFIEPEGTNSRKGDSGGGLYCRDNSDNLYLIGVGSMIIPKGDPVLEVFQDILFMQPWLSKNLKLDPPTLVELIQTKKSQITHYCGRGQECQNILNEQGILLTFDITQILEKIALEERNLAQHDNNTELLKSLDELKKSYIEFIARCYDLLKKKLSSKT
ncbi:MAG: trypsin-like serine protease [Bdellovibrionaceae bacterium]|nr:trypsin-like serine protease [Pseudobdellovibrionaceae bacterium]